MIEFASRIEMNRYRVPHHLHRRLMSPRQRNMYAVMLLFQLADRIAALDRKPPVTLVLIATNLLIFYFSAVTKYLPREFVSIISPVMSMFSVRRGCLNPSAVLSGQRARLLLSSFIHLSDLHVVYNCSSLLYKGVALEAALGSFIFFALVIYLSFTSHAIYVAVAVLARRFGYPSLMNNRVAGFSGVLFGLKVVLNANPQYGRVATNIFGFSLPGGAAPWVELVIASAAMPNVSFLGHLCGILAGITYVSLPKVINASRFSQLSNILRFGTFHPFQGRGRHLHSE